MLPADTSGSTPVLDLNDQKYRITGRKWVDPCGIMLNRALPYLHGPHLVRDGPVLDPTKIFSNPAIEEGDDKDSWEFVRYLGGGAFGRATLWEKIGPTNEVVETVVVKEIERDPSPKVPSFLPANADEPDLPQEVAIQRDLNIENNRTIVYLRNYKFGHSVQRGRLYMQHYEYGDLDRLYKLNMVYGHFLPEWFICEVILDFCEALETLEIDPPQDTKVVHNTVRGQGPLRPDGFQTWHGDQKPKNVMVGRRQSEHRKPKQAYPERPAVVMGDFGISEYSHSDRNADAFNPAHILNDGDITGLSTAGTPGYSTPVS
jgi:serine/threonine protein kinase